MNTPGRTAVIYARSATEYVGSPLLEAQLAECRAACATAGLRVVAEFVDAEASGLRHQRAGRLALRGLVETRAVGAVVMTSLDRYSRDSDDLAAFVQLCARNEITLFVEGHPWTYEASVLDAARLAATITKLRQAARRARKT